MIDRPDAQLSFEAPRRIRNGEIFEMRFRVNSHAQLNDVTIAITPSLMQDMTINTLSPGPEKESFGSGGVRWSYGPIEKGKTLVVKIDGQINPSLFGGTNGAVSLYDGDRRLGALPVLIRVLP